jgi:hypothetical protein
MTEIMNGNEHIDSLNDAIQNYSKEVEDFLDVDSKILKKSKFLSNQKTIILKCIIYGLITLVLSIVLSYSLYLWLGLKTIIVGMGLTIIFPLLVMSLVVLWSRGGEAAVTHEEIMNKLDSLYEKTLKDIQRLKDIDAPDEIVSQKWAVIGKVDSLKNKINSSMVSNYVSNKIGNIYVEDELNDSDYLELKDIKNLKDKIKEKAQNNT